MELMPLLSGSGQQATKCQLLELVPELRNCIYDYVFTVATPTGKVRLVQNCARPSVLALLQTCRRIHAEAESLFYHHNHLEMSGKWTLHAMLATLTFVRLRSIRRLTVVSDHAIEIWNPSTDWDKAQSLTDLHFCFASGCEDPEWLRMVFRAYGHLVAETLRRLPRLQSFTLSAAGDDCEAIAMELSKWQRQMWCEMQENDTRQQPRWLRQRRSDRVRSE